MRNWYVYDGGMILLDDVTCVHRGDDCIRVRHGLSDCWDTINGEGRNKQQRAESIEKIYEEVKRVLMKPLDK